MMYARVCISRFALDDVSLAAIRTIDGFLMAVIVRASDSAVGIAPTFFLHVNIRVLKFAMALFALMQRTWQGIGII